MPIQLFSDNAKANLSGNIADTDLVINVSVSDGALFATPTAGDWQMLTLVEGTTIEIVKCTANASGAFTVERAQEGTVAAAFTIEAVIYSSITATLMAQMLADLVTNAAAIVVNAENVSTNTGNISTNSGDIVTINGVLAVHINAIDANTTKNGLQDTAIDDINDNLLNKIVTQGSEVLVDPNGNVTYII